MTYAPSLATRRWAKEIEATMNFANIIVLEWDWGTPWVTQQLRLVSSTPGVEQEHGRNRRNRRDRRDRRDGR